MGTIAKILGVAVVIIVCVAFVAGIIMLLNLLNKRQMTGNNPLKKYHRNPEGAKLSPAEQRVLNIGAILSEVNHEFCDSLQSLKYSAAKHLRQNLTEWWGISCAEEAEKALERLKIKGHRQVFSVILANASEILNQEPSFEDFQLIYKRAGLPLIDEEISTEYEREVSLVEKHADILHAMHTEKSKKEVDSLIEQHKALFDDDATFSVCIQIYGTILNKYSDFAQYAKNLKNTVDKLRNRGFLGEHMQLERINPAAWDMGRMVNVARWCYSCGYITESMAWEYMFFAEKESSNCYADWADFSNAYVTGRAIWGGADEVLDVTMDIVEGLLKDEKSPWQLIPLR